MDRSLMVFKGEVYNQFQSVEDKISQSQDKVLGVLSDVMGELQTIRDEKIFHPVGRMKIWIE